jgi:hypothetical protein
MTISRYLCHVVGEEPERAARFHADTVRRTKAFAIAIHIPVLLWALTSYVVASHIFKLQELPAVAVAFFCSGLIYLVERLVLAMPKGWSVTIARLVIGVVISVLGASMVDLVLFNREISQQLRQAGETRMQIEHDKTADVQRQTVVQKKTDWLTAQQAANCEANGTCGTKVRSVGPVYRELSRQAAFLRVEYVAAQAELELLGAQKTLALAQWRTAPQAVDQAGLLARVQALHQYTMNNTAALVAWVLFFILVLCFELMVVALKLMSHETVDDKLERIREGISLKKAQDYMEAVTSPVASARQLIAASYD